jgi:hypothetical protein
VIIRHDDPSHSSGVTASHGSQPGSHGATVTVTVTVTASRAIAAGATGRPRARADWRPSCLGHRDRDRVTDSSGLRHWHWQAELSGPGRASLAGLRAAATVTVTRARWPQQPVAERLSNPNLNQKPIENHVLR